MDLSQMCVRRLPGRARERFLAVAGLNVALQLFQAGMAGDGGGFDHIAAGINQAGRCRLTQPMERAMREARQRRFRLLSICTDKKGPYWHKEPKPR